MGRPKAYEPIEGYKYQILGRDLNYGREWEGVDYAKDDEDLKFLILEYKLAYPSSWEFKIEMIPQRYWKEVS